MDEPADHAAILRRLVDKEVSRDVVNSLERYVDILRGAGVQRGLLGPREAVRLWSRHVLNCAALAPLLRPGASVADVGSGAGLPGVVLAILRPDVSFTLIEPLLRRATFLTEVIDALGISANTSVTRERAEDHSGPTFDVVVARAVAPLDKLAAWSMPLLRSGGTLLAVKGQQAEVEVSEHRARLSRLGARHIEVMELGAEVLAPPTTVVRLQRR
jgi:16S rRNA (guanine527-N7)-methyltransferase